RRAVVEDAASGRRRDRGLRAVTASIIARDGGRRVERELSTTSAVGRRGYGRRHYAFRVRHGLREEHVGLVEVLARPELAAHALPRGLLVLARAHLQVLHATKIDGDLAARTDPDELLLHQGLTEPRDTVLTAGARLLQLA